MAQMLRAFRKVVPAATVAVVTGAIFAAAALAAPSLMTVAGDFDGGPYTPTKCVDKYWYGVYDSDDDNVYDDYSGIYTYSKRNGGAYQWYSAYKTPSKLRCSTGGGGGGGGGGTTPPVETPPVETPPVVTPPVENPGTPGNPAPSDGNITVVGGQAQYLSIGDLGLILKIPATFTKEGNAVKLSFTKATDAAAAAALAKAQTLLGNSLAKLTLNAVATGFTVDVTEGTDAFLASITGDITVKADAGKEIVQVFYVNADGSLVPVRTKVSPNGVTFPIPAEGTYITLQVDKQFVDTLTHWVNTELKVAAAHLIADGYPDGTFLPEGNVTRAEFVALLVRSMGLAPASGTTQFSDVAADAWYANLVKAGVDAKLINGMDATHFAPNAQITREQMLALLGRAATNAGIAKQGNLSFFVDANALSSWSLSDAAAAYGAGLVNGEPAGAGYALNPSDTATRAEAAAILERLFLKVD